MTPSSLRIARKVPNPAEPIPRDKRGMRTPPGIGEGCFVSCAPYTSDYSGWATSEVP